MRSKLIPILYLFATLFVLILGPARATDLKSIEQKLSDSVITTKITTRFTESRQLNPFKIFVSTRQGVVTLKGHVNDKAAYIEALRLAKKTSGVKSINCEDLDIKRVNTIWTDAYITAKVEAAILKAKVLDDESIPLVGINAKTKNGVVMLSGEVKTRAALSAIIKRATAVRGVKEVISHLKINKDMA